MNPRKILNAIAHGYSPDLVAAAVYSEANDTELEWLLGFLAGMVNHMADLETTQGGYRSDTELHLGHWCKTLKGYMAEMEETANGF